MEKAAQWFDEGVDGEANDITVGWTPTNYTAASDDVLAHLKGIDTRVADASVSSDGVMTALDKQKLDGTGLFNGLEDASKFTITYNASTGDAATHRIFTVTVAAGGGVVFVGGKRFAIAAGTYTTTQHADTSSDYCAYFNSSGVLTVATTFPSFAACAPVAYVNYNATTKAATLFNEKHPAQTGMDDYTHGYMHNTFGALLSSGCTVSGYTKDTAGDAALSYAVASGIMYDEDLMTNITGLADGGPYPIYYRSGADASSEWTVDVTSVNGILGDGTNVVYNKLTTGNWANAAITNNNRWMNMWLCVAPVLNPTTGASGSDTFLVMGQAEYTSLAAAQAADPAVNISWGSFPFKEVIVVARLTYRRVNASSPSNVQLTEVQYIRANRIGITAGVSPSSHGALSGRSDDNSHPATAISNTPAGNIAAVNVQTAINELDTEKAGLALANSFTARQTMKSATGLLPAQISFRATDRDGICAAQQLGAAGDLVINGAFASAGAVDCSNGFQGPLTSGPVCSRYVSLYSAGNLSGVNFTVYGLKIAADGTITAGSTTVAGPNNEQKGISGNFLTVTRVAADAAVGADVEVGILGSGVLLWLSPEYNHYCVTEPAMNWSIELLAALAAAGQFNGYRVEVLKDATARTITWVAGAGVTLVSETLTVGGNSKLMGYNVIARNPSGGALKLLVSNAFAEP